MKFIRHLLLLASIITISSCGTSTPSESGSTPIEPGEFMVSSAKYYTDQQDVMSGDFTRVVKCNLEYAYYSNLPNIIYMTMDTVFNAMFDTGVAFDKNGDTITYTLPVATTFVVDASKNIITATRYESLNLFSTKYDVDFGLIDEETTTAYVKNEGSTLVDNQTVVFDLNKYHMSIVQHQDKFYIPFTVLNYMTFNFAYWSSVAFNGSDFYFLDVVSGAFGISVSRSTYAKDFYKGKYRGQERPRYFAEHNYYSFMFFLDHYYGFLDERFAPWDEYLTNNYPDVKENLLSDKEEEYADAVDKIINRIIGDGHSNSYSATSAYGTGSYNGNYYYSDRTIRLNDAYNECYLERRKAFGDSVPRLRFYENTAVITFDGFNHAGIRFTKDNIDDYYKNDTFALFHYAFKNIKHRTEINNVVLDITCNGGGDTNALVPMLGYLTDDIHIQQYSPLTKAKCDLHYQIDTNLDGQYDGSDTFKDKYNFYVLTSNYSFSCASLFPGVCKKENYAKIIGQNGGGGACVVYYSATPDGKTFRISGNMRESGSNGYSSHFDDGVPVDYELPLTSFYDDAKLVTFINNLSD